MNEIVYTPTDFDKKMWGVYLDIWKEFDRVAKKYNLTYFLYTQGILHNR